MPHTAVKPPLSSAGLLTCSVCACSTPRLALLLLPFLLLLALPLPLLLELRQEVIHQSLHSLCKLQVAVVWHSLHHQPPAPAGLQTGAGGGGSKRSGWGPVSVKPGGPQCMQPSA